jgi:hypothetical protein
VIFYLLNYNSPNVKTFWITIEYLPVLWQDLCIYDIACAGSVDAIVAQNSTLNSTFDPTTYQFLYDSLVRYQVGIINNFIREKKSSCQWQKSF